MELIGTSLDGCFEIKLRSFEDHRGSLTKVFHQPTFADLSLPSSFPEEYFSISHKGVVRGLHFQVPPSGHAKCVTCISGSIFDVAVDLRKNSLTFGKHYAAVIDSRQPKLLFIPEGFAHGFMALEDHTIFLNRSTSVYDPACDSGIKWDSCGILWPEIPPIVSEKDQNMPLLSMFNSPF
ncbi:MAG: dTDP-4-dehydrorhamnose 3,5-epimerase [Cecembia sp.]